MGKTSGQALMCGTQSRCLQSHIFSCVGERHYKAETHVISVPLGESGIPKIVEEVDMDALAHVRFAVVEVGQQSLAWSDERCVQRLQHECAIVIAVVHPTRDSMQ